VQPPQVLSSSCIIDIWLCNAWQGVAVVMLLPLVWILRSNAAKAQARAIAADSRVPTAGAGPQPQLQEPLLNGRVECASEAAAVTAGGYLNLVSLALYPIPAKKTRTYILDVIHEHDSMLLVSPPEENVAAPRGLVISTRMSLERERLLEQAANGYDAPLATTPK
jgi:hypothetical protein